MCIMRTYPTHGRDVLDPPPRTGNYTSHSPAGVMRLPRHWRRSESWSLEERDQERGRVIVGHSHPRAIAYYDEPRRSTTRARSVSRRRISDVELRSPRARSVSRRRVSEVELRAPRARSVSRRRISDVESRGGRGSFVDERERVVRRSVSRVRH